MRRPHDGTRHRGKNSGSGADAAAHAVAGERGHSMDSGGGMLAGAGALISPPLCMLQPPACSTGHACSRAVHQQAGRTQQQAGTHLAHKQLARRNGALRRLAARRRAPRVGKVAHQRPPLAALQRRGAVHAVHGALSVCPALELDLRRGGRGQRAQQGGGQWRQPTNVCCATAAATEQCGNSTQERRLERWPHQDHPAGPANARQRSRQAGTPVVAPQQPACARTMQQPRDLWSGPRTRLTFSISP